MRQLLRRPGRRTHAPDEFGGTLYQRQLIIGMADSLIKAAIAKPGEDVQTYTNRWKYFGRTSSWTLGRLVQLEVERRIGPVTLSAYSDGPYTTWFTLSAYSVPAIKVLKLVTDLKDNAIEGIQNGSLRPGISITTMAYYGFTPEEQTAFKEMLEGFVIPTPDGTPSGFQLKWIDRSTSFNVQVQCVH